MSLETTLVAALKGDASVTAFIGDRLRAVEGPVGFKPPYVIYELISSSPVESPAAGSETNESVIDVACYGTDYTNAKELARAVRAALINSLGASVIEDENDARDDDTQRKSVVQTYRIWHDETFP